MKENELKKRTKKKTNIASERNQTLLNRKLIRDINKKLTAK